MTQSAGDLSPATTGVGPLLQRDYWAFVENPRLRANEMGELLARELPLLAPKEYVQFRHARGDAALCLGDQLEVQIRGAGTFAVRVTHADDHSLTLSTVRGHPEAGRITFGAYPNHRGSLLVHVRSRARSGSLLQRFGFVVLGESLQTSTWGELVKAIAATVGDGVAGSVREETREMTADEESADNEAGPTFIATGA